MSTTTPVRVVQMGLGPIGQACVRQFAGHSGIDLVGGIDVDPEKVGTDLGDLCGYAERLGPVRGDVDAALAEWKPQVVVHTTTSFLHGVEGQLESIIRAGAHVVSSTEELFHPFERDPEFCERIDALAREHGVAVVGTGVNPGFAMDLLPLCVTGVCTKVRHLTITRVVDAAKRRAPFQRKVGAGLTVDEFEDRLDAGGFGHIGLQESALCVMAAMGWPVDSIEETLEPVIATKPIRTDVVKVEPGEVAGLKQVMRLESGGEERVRYSLQMSVGARESYDQVEVAGDPPLNLTFTGGIFGDTATVGALQNTIPRILAAQPGLRTMLELPVPRVFVG